MKFKGIVIGLLTAILVVNAVMTGLLVTEAKKQTEYGRITAEATITGAQGNLTSEQDIAFYTYLSDLKSQLLEIQYGIKTD